MFRSDLFTGKKILITGDTGFKGTWLSTILMLLGGNVYGYSKNIPTKPSHYEMLNPVLNFKTKFDDILSPDFDGYLNYIRPDFVFHLAAQSLVPESIKEPHDTFLTNAIGTSQVLNSLSRYSGSVNVVLITSDKVYKNNEWIWGYRENDQFGGKDPYSASKACAELIIHSYVQTYLKDNQNIKIAIGRAGNVIGGGDWSNNRLVPDAYRAWESKNKVQLRNPSSTRPWQHVLEPLAGYIVLADRLDASYINYEAYNFGPDMDYSYSVLDVIKRISQQWNDFDYEVNVDDSISSHESGLLSLNCDKAKNELGWKPLLTVDESIDLTSEWYYEYKNNHENAAEITINQIKRYLERASIYV